MFKRKILVDFKVKERSLEIFYLSWVNNMYQKIEIEVDCLLFFNYLS